jgi:hypothetical protein
MRQTAAARFDDAKRHRRASELSEEPQTKVPHRLRAFDGAFSGQRNRYCLWIVTPQNYVHHQAYDEVALGLHEGFAELGGSAPIIRSLRQMNGRTLIVIGPQLLAADALTKLPADAVLLNLEQADRASDWMSPHYLDLMRQRPLVDYSCRNITALKTFGIHHAKLLPIGYAPGLTRIRPAATQDIDVLFYGSLNERRRHVLDALEARGVKVQRLFGSYGAERDAAIARAKIVLNLHFYEAAIFESVRVSFLLANRVCVVSEGDAADPDLAPFAEGLTIAPYEALVDRCLGLLADADARVARAQAGFEAIGRRRQAPLIKALFSA